MQLRVAPKIPRIVTVSESSKRDIAAQMGVPRDQMTVVHIGVDENLFRPLPGVERVPGRLMTTASADVPLKGLTILLEALAKARVERPDAHLVVIGRLKDGSAVPALIESLGLDGAVEFVSGVTDERIVELYAEAAGRRRALPLRGLLPARRRGHGVRRARRRHHRGSAARRSSDRTGRAPAQWRPATLRRSPRCSSRSWATPSSGRGWARTAGFAFSRDSRGAPMRWGWSSSGERSSRSGRARWRMLTVDLDRLRLGSGDSLLDMGCGGGRHAFAALRRGARVVAFDADGGELKAVRDMVEAMQAEAEIPASGTGLPVQGDALALPFADGAFDRIIAAEVLEHIPDDRSAMAELARVLKPGGRMAVSVPARFPERINWALDSEYHDFPGGHIRIYRQHELESRLEDVGLVLRGSHHAHALHSPYWWIRCAGGVNNPDRLLARRYHDVLVWQIMKNPPVLRYLDRALNPVLGKSLVVYVEKP